LINSKGFGGNNATAALLGPAVTEELLRRHHGQSGLKRWAKQHESVEQIRQTTEQNRLVGAWSPTYRFNDGVVEDEDIQIDSERITIAGRVVELDANLPSDWRL
jgi:acetoacetyl-[acyl-carrier protein] synthase